MNQPVFFIPLSPLSPYPLSVIVDSQFDFRTSQETAEPFHFSPVWPVDKVTPPPWLQTVGDKKIKALSGYNFSNACWKLRYVAKGGKTGRLFSCKPHELVRYTRLIRGV